MSLHRPEHAAHVGESCCDALECLNKVRITRTEICAPSDRRGFKARHPDRGTTSGRPCWVRASGCSRCPSRACRSSSEPGYRKWPCTTWKRETWISRSASQEKCVNGENLFAGSLTRSLRKRKSESRCPWRSASPSPRSSPTTRPTSGGRTP
ncbi:hypothetical protein E3U43_007983 [Larimichthys crocea]|uniref:Uncharacterized protein n=1 Tax=Larimichthys crocea TaxID=215358 RepID=A0ACD3Q5R1_LARCR|nr:hypothetical protein E3U43_007983 [Larimichthys crocea]